MWHQGQFQRAIRLSWERFEVAEDFNQTSGLLTYDKRSMWPACHHWARIRIPVAGKISTTIKSVPLRENDWSGLKNRIRNSCSATISGIDFAVVLIFATWNCMEKKFHVSLGDIIELCRSRCPNGLTSMVNPFGYRSWHTSWLTIWNRELKSVNCWKTVFDKNRN